MNKKEQRVNRENEQKERTKKTNALQSMTVGL